MAGWIATALYLLDLAIKMIALGVVPKNRRPSSGMAWLLLILMIPFVGFVIFLVLGRTRLGRRRHEQQAEVNAIVAERTAHVPTLETDFPGPGVRAVGGHPEPQPGRAAGDARQPGRPVPGVRRVASRR